jgi:coatomer protein complex subunit gamma
VQDSPNIRLTIEIDSVYSLATLESKLLAYVNNPEAQTEAFDIQTIPKVSREQARQEAARESFSYKFSPMKI